MATFNDLDLAQRNVFKAIEDLFRSYGLGSLAPRILEYVKQGYDGNTVGILLQDTPEYKQRFKANEDRLKRGLPVLSPAEYLAVERSYGQIMRSYGLPPGFYDQPADFAKFISSDVSPQELGERVQMASRLVNNANPEAKAALAEFYPELSEGDLIANILDPNAALPLIERKVKASEIAGAAKRLGMSSPDRSRAESYADLGFDGQRANEAYQQIGTFLPETDKIGDRFKTDYSQDDAEQEVFGGMASARRKRERLFSSERGLFNGGSGVERGSLSTNTSGSY